MLRCEKSFINSVSSANFFLSSGSVLDSVFTATGMLPSYPAMPYGTHKYTTVTHAVGKWKIHKYTVMRYNFLAKVCAVLPTRVHVCTRVIALLHKWRVNLRCVRGETWFHVRMYVHMTMIILSHQNLLPSGSHVPLLSSR